MQLQKEVIVNEKMKQKLKDTQNTAGQEYEWDCKFHIYIPETESDHQIIQCVIYIDTKATQEVIAKWQAQITDRWSYKFALKTTANKVYPITVQIHKDEKRKDKDYKITAIKSKKARGGRGLFGTESMIEWGEADSQDIPHEVGHMLGNKDEYGEIWDESTQKWINYGYAHEEVKEDKRNVMLRGDFPVRERHFGMILKAVNDSGDLGQTKLIKYMKAGIQ